MAVVANLRLDRSIGRSIFGADAAGYDAVRLGYPAELYDRLFERAGPASGLSIFEIGPGTGLATRDLLRRRPARLLAIEPDPALAEHLAAAFPVGLEVEAAPFEESVTGDCQFELGVAAACFHWLDPETALARVRRLLRPGGSWAMWWHIYRAAGVGDPFADEIVPLLQDYTLPPSEAAARHISLERGYHETLLREHGFLNVEYCLFRRERTLAGPEMRALYASYSFVRALPDDERAALLDEVSALVERRFGGRAPNVVLTPLYIADAP